VVSATVPYCRVLGFAYRAQSLYCYLIFVYTIVTQITGLARPCTAWLYCHPHGGHVTLIKAETEQASLMGPPIALC
jgi:hypothetical protein